jgi:hypothetical protein
VRAADGHDVRRVTSDRELEPVRFEARELKPYGEPVEPTALQVGAVYFALTYVDADMLLPTLKPAVYIGKALEPGDVEQFYFQDADSYRRAIRYQSADEDRPATSHPTTDDAAGLDAWLAANIVIWAGTVVVGYWQWFTLLPRVRQAQPILRNAHRDARR